MGFVRVAGMGEDFFKMVLTFVWVGVRVLPR